MRAVLLVIMLSVTVMAQAGEWRPFVGVGGVVDYPIRGYDLLGHAAEERDPYTARKGTQFELGVRTREHGFYVAYHLTNSRVSEYRSVQDAEVDDALSHYVLLEDTKQDSYRERLFILGYRYEPAARPRRVVRPILGGGLGIDRTTYRYGQQALDMDYTYHSGDWLADTLAMSSSGGTRRSRLLPGILLEFGVALKVWRQLDLLAMCDIYAHAERYAFGSHYGQVTYRTDYLLTPSVMLQARYTIGEPERGAGDETTPVAPKVRTKPRRPRW